MPRIAFLIAAAAAGNDNHERLPRAFAALGWSVERLERDSLALARHELTARALGGGARIGLTGFDLYFQLGFGPQASFLDRMQLLGALDAERFVNTPNALIHHHGKISLHIDCPDIAQPATHLDCDAQALAAIVARGGEWIAKPPAASFGRDVFRLRAGDTNVRAILEHLTRDGRYAIVQEYVAAPAAGEKRVLVAAGELIGAYRKIAADHRGNLGAGAGAAPTMLGTAERRLAERLGRRLDALGVRFAAIDLRGDCVLEANVANPGWLQTYERIAGENRAPQAAAALARRFAPRHAAA